MMSSICINIYIYTYVLFSRYIDFLEACGLPVDPTDPAVQDVEINTWKGQYSTLPSEVLEEIGINPNIEESDEVSL